MAGKPPPDYRQLPYSITVGGMRSSAYGAGWWDRSCAATTDFEYGERQYSAEDPSGHHWTFTETLTDVAPQEWGGEPAHP